MVQILNDLKLVFNKCKINALFGVCRIKCPVGEAVVVPVNNRFIVRYNGTISIVNSIVDLEKILCQ